MAPSADDPDEPPPGGAPPPGPPAGTVDSVVAVAAPSPERPAQAARAASPAPPSSWSARRRPRERSGSWVSVMVRYRARPAAEAAGRRLGGPLEAGSGLRALVLGG